VVSGAFTLLETGTEILKFKKSVSVPIINRDYLRTPGRAGLSPVW
jgi:hypothetical protein